MRNEVDQSQELGSGTFTEAILGRFDDRQVNALVGSPLGWKRAAGKLLRGTQQAINSRYGVPLLVGCFAALIFIPYLGAVGLWDPWETHYGEVGRMMIQRNDYVHPFWESAYFYSKPALTMWMQALGMLVVGTNRNEAPISIYTEWALRLPFALSSILALAMLSLAVARIVSKRAALAMGFILATMPLFFLLTRQSVTDTPFVAFLSCAMACAMIGQLDDTTRHRAAWWYGFYVFCGLSTLAKGLLGFGIPAVVLLLYAALCFLPWSLACVEEHVAWPFLKLQKLTRPFLRRASKPEPASPTRVPILWQQFFNMRLGTGILVFLAITVPWYTVMFAFRGLDDEGREFWWRFLIQDHLNRLMVGVHTTTPRGTFIYFIEQGAYAIFPWVALLPGALAIFSRIKLRSNRKSDQLLVIAALWAVFSFWLVAESATKFHHYIFPVLPALAILMGAFIDRLWEEGIAQHAGSLILGLALFLLVGKDISLNPKNFTDLFVYNYSRPYPNDLIQRSLSLFNYRAMWVGDLAAAVLFAAGLYLAIDAFANRSRSIFLRALALLLTTTGVALAVTLATRGQVAPTRAIGIALLAVAIYLGFYVFRDAQRLQGQRASLIAAFVLLLGAALSCIFGSAVTPGPDPLLPSVMEPVNIKVALGFCFGIAAALFIIATLLRARVMLFGSFWALAFSFAIWLNWSHWVDLSHHWTQRDLFWRYYAQRKPDEPIVAFMMNWRGETFYSKNTVKQIKDNGRLSQYAALPGRKWALVEHDRLGLLRNAVGADKTVTLIDKDLNNKFVLVSIE